MSARSFPRSTRICPCSASDRARQHRERRGRARREARPHRRLRLDQPDVRLARRPRAGADGHPVSPARRRVRPHAGSLRRLGEIPGEPARGEERARYAQGILDDVAARVASVPPERRPRVYYGRGPRGLDTGLAGSINMESIERVGARMSLRNWARAGSCRSRSSRCWRWDPDVIVTIDRTFYASLGATRCGRG